MIHYNYDCDFKIAEQLIADAPFRYTYYAKSEKTVVAEYDGTDYHGCYPMGDMLIVPINAGSLGLGEVKVRREYFLTDKDFTDGICNRVTGNVPLGIEIWRGETDGMETHEVKVVPAYQKGDPFTFDDMTDAQKQDIANRVPTKEPEREKAEAKREQNELLRQAKEAERETKEAERQSIFSTNEAERQQIFETNEAIREENETKRVDAEILRQEAETRREATYKNKVDREDNAPKLTAGFANNLVGRGEATPQEISFRPSGGDTSIEDGTAWIERLKGSTVVWNQLARPLDAQNYETLSTIHSTLSFNNGVAELTIKESPTYVAHATIRHKKDRGLKFIAGQKYILIYSLKASVETTIYFSIDGKNSRIGINWADYVRFATPSTNNDSSLHYIGATGGTPVGTIIECNRIQVFNLTQMFGAGNEPTSIEEFNARKPIGIDEYAYNEGELISNNVEELKSVGFNAWDEEWELGAYEDSNGGMLNSKIHIRNSTPIKVLPNMAYEFVGPVKFVYWYDADMNFISPRIQASRNTTHTSPANAAYMNFYVYQVAEYNHDICIHLAHTGYRNGEYDPYKEFRRSIPIKDIKDSDGNQLFPNGLLSAGSVYDEITPTKAIKRIGVVDMGTLTWTRIKASAWPADLLYAEISDAKKGLNIGGRMARYSRATNTATIANKHYITGANSNYVYVRDDSYTDAATFKAAMSGVMLYYELAEPIEADLEEPINLDYEVSDFGTEEVISDAPTTPMKADIIYQFNAVDRIRDNSRHTAEAAGLLNAKADKTTVEDIQKRELVLSVKDNGNIILSNANGESKEFMPATPSGDPLHYAYVKMGAKWNDELVDKEISPTLNGLESLTGKILHKSKRWALVDVGDLSTDEMKVIYDFYIKTDVKSGYCWYKYKGRAVAPKSPSVSLMYFLNNSIGYAALREANMSTYCMPTGDFLYYDSSLILTNNAANDYFQNINNGYRFAYNNKSLKRIHPLIFEGSANQAFNGCESLEVVTIKKISSSISFADSPNLTKGSVLFMIKYSTAKSAITITLHPDAYARLVNDAEIVAELESKNASLQSSGGSISIVSA